MPIIELCDECHARVGTCNCYDTETNAERINRIYGQWNYEDNLVNDDVDWIIERAKKVEGYEKAIEFAIDYLSASDIGQVQMVVKSLKQALEK